MKLNMPRGDFMTYPSLRESLKQVPTPTAWPDQTDPSALVIWCPADVSMPTPNQNRCSGTYRTLNELWMALVAKNPATAGTIWIGKNYNSVKAGDANLLFDGLTLTMMAEYDLTIQGGWEGLGEEAIDPNIPSTLDGISLLIFNWTGNITLKDLRLQNAIGHSGKAALCVRTAGSIQIERVLANHSLYGSSLDNTASLSSPPASVTVAASDFSGNDYAGLAIYTKGAVTLQNVIANRNLLGYGISILNTNDIAASPVTVIDGQFNENDATGLAVQSNGVVILNSVQAQDNGRRGAAVDNRYGSGDVLLQGTNNFLSNGLHGLQVYSKGRVTAQKLTAIANGASGLWLLTNAVADADTPAVTLNEVHADRNGCAGLELYADGQVDLVNSSTYQNINYGLYVRAANTRDAAAGLKLQGFLSDLNGTDEDVRTDAPVVRSTVSP
jgi:hypothetical protein